MTTRVILICYYFPPQGGAGVGRPLALYKHLPKYGVKCDILTVKPVAYRLNEPELLDGVDTSRIYRAGSFDPQRLMYLMGIRKVKDSTISKGRKLSDRFFPDPKVGWVRPAVKLGRVLAANRHYKAVIATSPPMSSHLVGMKLAKEFNLPLIADFRDFWTGSKAEDWFDDPKQVERAKALLETIVTKSARVITVNSAISTYLGKGEVIFNSFDEKRAQLWKPPSSKEYFKIGILGTLDEQRPIEPLLRVLAGLRERKPALFEKIKVVHVGSLNIENADGLLRHYGLDVKFELLGVKRRDETIKILSETSALYLGFSRPYGSWLVTGRLFDMLASGRPILAAAPSGSVVGDILQEAGIGCTYSEGEEERAVDFIAGLIDTSDGWETICHPNPDYAQKYSSERMAEQFAQVIKSLV